MIKSKFNSYPIFQYIMVSLVFLFLSILLSLAKNDDSNNAMKIKSLTNVISYSACYVFVMFSIIIYFSLKKFIIITIDNEKKIIQFKNAITRFTKQYDFSYFDGYLVSSTKTALVNYKVLVLVKNKKSWKRIEGHYYSNFNEVLTSLSSMHYFGFQENIFRLNRRIILNKEIID